MEDIRIQGLTADEWEKLSNPEPTTDDDIEQLGFVQPQDSKNKIYETADTLGVERPKDGKQYADSKLNWQTVKDVGTSLGVEASHLFAPKERELQYESQTRAGEAFKYGYRYLAGTASLFIGGGAAGVKIATKLPKFGAGIQKLFTGANLIKTGENASKVSKVGAAIANASLGGAFSGAVADFALYRPEDNEGHIADVFGKSDNALVSFFQTQSDDSEFDSKLKNVTEGFIIGIGAGNLIEFGLKPVFVKAIKNVKALIDAKFPKQAEDILKEVALDEVRLERLGSNVDIYNKVDALRLQADESGEELSQLLIDNFNIKDLPDAQKISEIIEQGRKPYFNEDGSFSLKVEKWDEAHTVSKEDYINQRTPDEKITDMDEAVKHTWTNRGWIGENEKLTLKNANKVAKNYKSKWDIDKNIKVEFIDGLVIDGKNVEGNTSFKQNGKDIIISIDKNSTNPYSVFRSELEHARDFATGAKGTQDNTHSFPRYNDVRTEDALAGEYVYKKSQGKASVLKIQDEIQLLKNNVKQAKEEGLSYKSNPNIVELKDKSGNSLGYVEYSSKEGILNIDEIRNTTKRQVDIKTGNKIAKKEGDVSSTRGVGEKLVDKLISDNPTKQIKWDAVTPDGISFKNQYLAKHPKLKDKIVGITNPNELDQEGFEAYNSMLKTRGEDATGNTSRYDGSNAREAQGNINTNNTKKSGRVETTTAKQMGSRDRAVVSSNNQGDTGRRLTDFDPSSEQLKLDFNTKTAKQTTAETLDNISKGLDKPTTVTDIDGLVNKIINDEAEISGFTWKNIADDAENIITKLLDEVKHDKDLSTLVKELTVSEDVTSLDALSRRVLALQKVKSVLLDNLPTNKDVSFEVKSNILDTLQLIGDYTKDMGSGAGRLLESRKLINKAVETFGDRALSKLTKEGINVFADLLKKSIDEVINLNFTKTDAIQSIITKLIKEDEAGVFQAIFDNPKLMKRFDEITSDVLSKNKSTDTLSEDLFKMVVETSYDEVIESAAYAPLKEGKFQTFLNGAKTVYITHLLSGFGTVFKNGVSGVLNSTYFPAVKLLASGLGAGEGADRLAAEGWHTYRSMFKSMQESFSLAQQAWINGEGSLTNLKELADADNIKNYTNWKNFDEINSENWKDTLWNYYSMMSRAMMASDEFLSQLNYRSISRGKASAQAEELLKSGKINETQFDEVVEDIFSRSFNKDGKPTNVDALYEAKQAVYQTDLDGTITNFETGNKIQKTNPSLITKGIGGFNKETQKNPLLKFVFPFLRTGANILQAQLDHNVVAVGFNDLGAYLTKGQKSRLLAQTPEGALTRSRCAFGIMSLVMGGMMAANGLITGSAPTNPKERKALFATGWRPYSIKVGDKWVSYQGYEPLHGTLGLAADSYTIMATLKDPDNDQRWQQAQGLAFSALINNYIDKAAFRNGLNQLAFLTNPDKAEEAKTALAQIGKGFLPLSSLIGNTSSVGQRDATAPKTPYERIMNNYFNRGLGDYRRDVFGNRQDIYGLIITTASDNKYDQPEYRELAILGSKGYDPSQIGKNISETKVKIVEFKDLTTGRSAYDAMQEELSKVKIAGKTLQQAVSNLVTGEYYQALPDGIGDSVDWGSSSYDTKVKELNDIFTDYNFEAEQAVISTGSNFVNSKGQTMQEVSEEVNLIKINKSLNNSLDGSAEKIKSLF